MKNFYKLILFIGYSCLITKTYAINQFIINNIRVNGLQRIEVGTVFSYLPVKVGDKLNDTTSNEIIKKLYSTGFFKDIRLEEQGGTLIIDVQERPVISELTVTGDKAFDHDLLVKSLKDNGLTAGKIFDQSLIDQAVMSLKSEYYNRGLYSVIITPKVVSLVRNRVTVNISIDEGTPAKIAAIEFLGAHDFSQKKLERQIFLTTGNWLSWWYKDNQYSSDKLSGDLETVRNFYLNQGYINFKINSVQVQLSADKKSVYITVNMVEGNKYTIKSIKLSGDVKNVPIEELRELLIIKPGSVVDQGAINKVTENLKNKLGVYGYAFAAVNPVPEIDNQKNNVAYTFFVDTGKKIYVRKINIMGNDVTRDMVIRRELRQSENALYDSGQIQRSKDRLNLLGYFKNTDVSTAPVPGSNDEVDMNVKVEENNTGSINFGIGYAQGQGILLNGAVSQTNLLGSGKSVSINASRSLLSQGIGISFTDPYALPNGTSLGYDVYDNGYSPNNSNISPYSTQTLGARIRTGVPVSEYDKINFSLGFENNNITTYGNNVPLRFIQFTNTYGNSVNALPFSIAWTRNTTDSTLWPTTGALFNQIADASLPEVGAQYYRFTSQNTWFFPLSTNFTWKTNAQLGFINPYGGSNAVPFYQSFYMGGINSIRGYYIGSMGPKDTDGSSLGGTRSVIFSNELMFPLPGLKDTKSVRLSLFMDTGALWGGNNFDLTPQQAFRASYGVGVNWISPLGPIKLSYALPLFNQPNDQLEAFQFMLGSSF
ncbi:MAG: bamA [Burkholderiales bacterium]|jgi:outer membrane protein insertion porin family|nr:bamA [Burkholderiales bacterium]